MSLINPDNLRLSLPPELQGILITCVEHTGSTNSDLLETTRQLSHNAPAPMLLQADVQSAGRGRLGRQWANRAEASLMFSLAWPLKVPIHFLSGLSLVCGIACARALTANLSAPEVQRLKVKWPNDLLLDNKKLGGILIEIVNKKNYCWTIIGIGINYQTHKEMMAGLTHPTAALDILRTDLTPHHLLAQLITSLAQQLNIFETRGFAAFKNDWHGFDAYYGKSVGIYENGQCIEQGIAVGVDDAGQLLLNTTNGIKQILAGEVSLRCDSI